MKTRIATVLLLSGLFLSSTAFSGELPAATKSARKEVLKVIKKELTYPQFAIGKNFECCVMVKVIVREDGSLHVDCVNSVDPIMKEYVTKKLGKLKTEKLEGFAGQQVLVRIKFKLLKV
ncbi:MAG: hypothetical protein L3J31_09380 [Bacteroidales bacterium]|nr:hypothetical protein [Bacteroidales bacterium]MCF6343001.1 hypothetical protein [Bacteroidales bacterium]